MLSKLLVACKKFSDAHYCTSDGYDVDPQDLVEFDAIVAEVEESIMPKDINESAVYHIEYVDAHHVQLTKVEE